jgi:hypothetical protein
MKPLFCFLVVITVSFSSYCQNVKTDTVSCLAIAKQLSYYWKLDSLANNGFRLYTYNKFLGCKLDDLSVEVLVTELGKPNEIRKTNKGTEYLYYFFDIKQMPKHYDAPRTCEYLVFRFQTDRSFLSAIEFGDMDRY